MGLLDLFQKGKQMVTDVQDEIENWRSIDPDVLRAIADEDLILAKNLYIQKTGASRVRAAMVVEKIAGTVQKEYPYDDPEYWKYIDPEVLRDVAEGIESLAILAYMRKNSCSEEKACRILGKIWDSVRDNYKIYLEKEALASVSLSWPHKESVVVGFKPTPHDKNKISIAYINLNAQIKDNLSERKYVLDSYYLLVDYFEYFSEPLPYFQRIQNDYTAIFKDGIIYLRNEDGDVLELEDFKIGDLNFNTQDSEYKRYKRIYDQLTSEVEFETFGMDDLKKVETGKMSEKALLSAATRYKFNFKRSGNKVFEYPKFYPTCIVTENFNLKDILKKHYLDFYKTIDDERSVVPWQYDILNLVAQYNEESCDKLDSVIHECIRKNFPECEALAEECNRKARSLIHTLNNRRVGCYFNCAEMRLNTQDVGEDKPIAVLALPLFGDIFHPTEDGIAALHRFPIHKPFENLELSIQLFKDNSKKIVLSANGLYREFSVIAKKK